MIATARAALKQTLSSPLGLTALTFKQFAMGWRDEWPTIEDSGQYDGKELLRLVPGGKSPFAKVWDVQSLLQETEKSLGLKWSRFQSLTKARTIMLVCACVYLVP